MESLISEINKKVITYTYEELLAKVRSYLLEEDIANIEKAYELASGAHGNQVRKSGQPYISHQMKLSMGQE